MGHTVGSTKQNDRPQHAVAPARQVLEGQPPPHSMLQLQRQAGNQAVLAMLRSDGIQPRLEIGGTQDPEEKAADEVADRVMRKPAGGFGGGACACSPGSEICGVPLEVPKNAAQDGRRRLRGPVDLQQALATSGRPLDPSTQTDMEARLGRDFGDVRIHIDQGAAKSADAIGALAYAAGSHIVFGQGHYAPRSDAGRRLLAHELAHTVQQGAARARPFASGSIATNPVVRRQLEGSGSSPAMTPAERDRAYQAALQTARRTGDWEQPAELLNGFNHEDIQFQLASLSDVEIGFLHQGALDNKNVGPQAQVAELTAPGVPRASTPTPQSSTTPATAPAPRSSAVSGLRVIGETDRPQALPADAGFALVPATGLPAGFLAQIPEGGITTAPAALPAVSGAGRGPRPTDITTPLAAGVLGNAAKHERTALTTGFRGSRAGCNRPSWCAELVHAGRAYPKIPPRRLGSYSYLCAPRRTDHHGARV